MVGNIWECPHCLTMNIGETRCLHCNEVKNKKNMALDFKEDNTQEWECPDCQHINHHKFCPVCGHKHVL